MPSHFWIFVGQPLRLPTPMMFDGRQECPPYNSPVVGVAHAGLNSKDVSGSPIPATTASFKKTLLAFVLESSSFAG